MHIAQLFDVADQSLFKTVLSNSHHVLHRLLPKNKTSVHNLRTRAHNLTLTKKSCYYDYTITTILLPACFLKGPIDSFTFLSIVTMRLVIVLNKRT